MFLNFNVDAKNESEISAETKSLIYTVIDRCIKEKNRLDLQMPLDDYLARASFYSGLPKLCIWSLHENSDNASVPHAYFISQLIEIWRQMRDLYLHKCMPTYFNVYKSICDTGHCHMPFYPQFYQKMILMGYDYKKTINGFLLMEDPKLSFERFHYLKRIKKLRDTGHQIYYLDERIMKLNLSFDKHWMVKKSNDSCRRESYIFFHVVSKLGYESGLYCNTDTEEVFKKWVTEIVLPELMPSSVIIMDRAPLHGFSNSGYVSRYESKENMLKWLKLRNIPCNINMHKAEVYELIEKCLIKPDENNVQQVLRTHGHEVLILPHNLQNLSLTEELWHGARRKLQLTGSHNINTLPKLKENVNNYIKELQVEEWKAFEDTVIKQEEEIYLLNTATEAALEHYEMDIVSCDEVSYSFNNMYIDNNDIM